MSQKKFKVKINGDSWQVHLLPGEVFKECLGANNAAATVPDKKSFFFRDDLIEKSTVVHEVMHAYFSYLYLGSTKARVSDVEEIVCDMVGNKIAAIAAISNKVYSALKKYS